MEPDLDLVRRLVRKIARSELLPRFAGVSGRIKHDGSTVTEADLVMQERLQETLVRHWPDIEFFGEEMTSDEHERLLAGAGKPLWCLDPLDGTSNYASGLPFFCVSLALLVGGESLLAVVYDPVRDECFSAMRGAGAWANGSPLCAPTSPLPAMGRSIAVVDFKRLEGRLAARLGSRPPYGSQRNFGSSALEWCWLARRRFHLYLHGGQKLWDYAAGSLVLAEAGGYAATLEGEPVLARTPAPRSVVAAPDAASFQVWSEWLAQFS
ncbi:MAG: inositol monophosphatase family protein [Gammaproteobacteria bacterium]|nr:inositol monophosphatase family protein [Gammaproteobacteria bacterium]